MGKTRLDSFNSVWVVGINLIQLRRQCFDLRRGYVPQIRFLTAINKKKNRTIVKKKRGNGKSFFPKVSDRRLGSVHVYEIQNVRSWRNKRGNQFFFLPIQRQRFCSDHVVDFGENNSEIKHDDDKDDEIERLWGKDNKAVEDEQWIEYYRQLNLIIVLLFLESERVYLRRSLIPLMAASNESGSISSPS